MEIKLIYEGKATVEDLQDLHKMKGFEFVIESGKVTKIIQGENNG